nr:PREDICTED: zinc finger protein 112-like [Bemisia tabaci]
MLGEEPGGRPRKGRGKDKRKGSSSQAGSDGGEDGGTYECKEPGCDKSYDSEIKLQRHMKYHNLKKQGHTCSQCGQGFSSKQRLQYHQESTGHVQVQAPKPPKPYPCTHEGCTKSYGSASRLRAHMKTHEG